VVDGGETSREIVNGKIPDGGDPTAVHDLHGVRIGCAPGLDQPRGAYVRRAQAILQGRDSGDVMRKRLNESFGQRAFVLLQIGILQPEQGMIGMLTLLCSHANRCLVCSYCVVPEPEGEKDVRCHVLRVRSRGRNFRIEACRSETQRCVHRIIVGVYQVMQRARMVVVDLVDCLHFRCRAHIRSDVAFRGKSKERERVQRPCV